MTVTLMMCTQKYLKKYGCDCVLVSWGFRERALLESFGVPVADSAPELLELLDRI